MNLKRALITGLSALALLSTAAWAASWFDAGGAGLQNVVMHFLVGSTATPVSAANPLPISPTNSSGAPLYVAPVVPDASARHFPGCTVAATSGTCLAASTAVTSCKFKIPQRRRR